MIFLVTCYHVISKEILDFYEEIQLIFNNNINKKLNLKVKRNKWYDKELDFMAIEIKDEDEIKVNIFEINDNCYNYEYDNNEYNKRSIVIPCFGDNNEIKLSYGIINYSENITFRHDCNTKYGNSGAPIILVNNIKIIGIHTGTDNKRKKNIGLFFQNILKYINTEKNKIEIIVEIDEIKN